MQTGFFGNSARAGGKNEHRRLTMTELENHLLRALKDLERAFIEREQELNATVSRLTMRLDSSSAQIIGLSEALERLGTRVNTLTEQLRQVQTGSRNSAPGQSTNKSSKSMAS